ncbi:hypothetical protein KIPB_004544 [Kipferlia bialata]|uniref:Uncharacterized protein n=1 Tax=Kipferlia bialata TaxID=797122 RepID=A0A9K3CTX8_9EUKA|nr:hypothetical protein KIPB_004544 [Kipferlia bialata]|eukprot:g4544.t1
MDALMDVYDLPPSHRAPVDDLQCHRCRTLSVGDNEMVVVNTLESTMSLCSVLSTGEWETEALDVPDEIAEDLDSPSMCLYGGEVYLFGCYGGMVHVLSLDTHAWRSIKVLKWEGERRIKILAVLDAFVLDDTIFLIVEHSGRPATYALDPEALALPPSLSLSPEPVVADTSIVQRIRGVFRSLSLSKGVRQGTSVPRDASPCREEREREREYPAVRLDCITPCNKCIRSVVLGNRAYCLESPYALYTFGRHRGYGGERESDGERWCGYRWHSTEFLPCAFNSGINSGINSGVNESYVSRVKHINHQTSLVPVGRGIVVLPVVDRISKAVMAMVHNTVSGLNLALGVMPEGFPMQICDIDMQLQNRSGNLVGLSFDHSLLYPHPDLSWAIE